MVSIMTLNELKQHTTAFDEFVTVSDSDLPEYYKGIFPKHCECGAEVIITRDSNTQLQCCNPDCWVKMSYKFAYFTKSLGFKGFGVNTAYALYRKYHHTFKHPSFLSIFSIPIVDISSVNGDAYATAFAELKDDLHNKCYQFVDAIAALGIPDVGKRSNLFDIIKSPEVLTSCILDQRLLEVCRMARIQAPKTHFHLLMSTVDMALLMSSIMPNILSTPKNEVFVAITGSVTVDGRALTRSGFISLCESILDKDGSQMFKLVETKAASKLDYVIADSPSSSSKYELGKRLNKLITAQDFYNLLRSTADKKEEVINDD